MQSQRSLALTAAGLAAVALLAFAVRAIGFEWIFTGGEVLLGLGDGHYQARRAFFSFARFPAALTFDPYINYPDGGVVAAAPLVPLLLGGLARLLASDVVGFERIMAWQGPVAGALTVLPVYAAGRAVAGRAVALGGAALFGLLPVIALASTVGDADHHAVLVLLEATLLALGLALLTPAAVGRRLVQVAAGLALARVLLVLSWSGSLLPVALLDGVVLLAGVLSGRVDRVRAQAASAAVSALLLLPAILALPTPPGGPWSAVMPSQLHVAGLLALAAIGGGFAWLETSRPARGRGARLGRVVGLGLAVAAALFALPGVRAGVLPGLDFVGMDSTSFGVVLELAPLFPLAGRVPAQPASYYYGAFAFLIPVAPLAALAAARDPRRRAAALTLAVWTALYGALAIWQVRFGADYAPGGCVAFALLLAGLTRVVVRGLGLRPAVGTALAVALALTLLAVPLRIDTLPRGRRSLGALLGDVYLGDRALATPHGSLVRFLEAVRRATPETSGFLDPRERPEYGVLVPSRIGHALHWVARRASAADGFLGLVGPENFAAAARFYGVEDEAEALALAERLQAPYVITMHFPGTPPGAFASRLQQSDGLGPGGATGRFRLVTEGPRGGRPMSDLLRLPPPRDGVAYKLFEVVEGARLQVHGPPGALVQASLVLRTPAGRSLDVVHRARLGDDGRAELRVAYPSDASAPVRAASPWRVRIGDASWIAQVSEREVRSGALVPVGPTGEREDPEPGTARQPAPRPGAGGGAPARGPGPGTGDGAPARGPGPGAAP